MMDRYDCSSFIIIFAKGKPAKTVFYFSRARALHFDDNCLKWSTHKEWECTRGVVQCIDMRMQPLNSEKVTTPCN